MLDLRQASGGPVPVDGSDPRRVLFLSHCIPHPPHSGGRIRSYHVLRELAKEFEVELLAFSRQADHPTPEARKRSLAHLGTVLSRVSSPGPVGSDDSRIRFLWDHLRSRITGRPYSYFQFANRGFAAELREALEKRRPGLIHLDTLHLLRWLDELPAVPIVCVHHDVESELLRRTSEREENRLRRTYLAWQADRFRRVEESLCPLFAANVVTSERDAKRISRIAPGSPVTVVPNAVDTSRLPPCDPSMVTEGRVLFLGSTDFSPNRDAVAWLLDEIWPRVRECRPSASLCIVGKVSDEDRRLFESSPGVRTAGRVPDVRPYVEEAVCTVVPMRFGGGTRIKILEAWALGRPVVSTPLGCEGLRGVDGKNILLRDAPDAFADAVVALIDDAGLRRSLVEEGRTTVLEHYDWSSVGRKMRTLYDRLLEDHRGAEAARAREST